jgi:hypothetical protein
MAFAGPILGDSGGGDRVLSELTLPAVLGLVHEAT